MLAGWQEISRRQFGDISDVADKTTLAAIESKWYAILTPV